MADSKYIRDARTNKGNASMNQEPRGYREFIRSADLKDGEWIDAQGWIHYPYIEGRKVLTFGKFSNPR